MTTALQKALDEMPARAKRVVDQLVEGGLPASPSLRFQARTNHWAGSGMAFWNLLNERMPQADAAKKDAENGKAADSDEGACGSGVAAE